MVLVAAQAAVVTTTPADLPGVSMVYTQNGVPVAQPIQAGTYTVTATLDRDTKHGGVSCSVCGASFEMAINPLTEAVDVYSAWIDECEEANQA